MSSPKSGKEIVPGQRQDDDAIPDDGQSRMGEGKERKDIKRPLTGTALANLSDQGSEGENYSSVQRGIFLLMRIARSQHQKTCSGSAAREHGTRNESLRLHAAGRKIVSKESKGTKSYI